MNMSATVTESANLPQRQAQHHAVTFTGNGREYFGIWIVDVLLSIVTLGIYSAWAKVRRMQYFARNTQIVLAEESNIGRVNDPAGGAWFAQWAPSEAERAVSSAAARSAEERRLFYVACSRARDHLLVTGVTPVSEFVDDFLKGN